MAGQVETELTLDGFPAPEVLRQRYCEWKGFSTPESRSTVATPYYDDGSSNVPRYYQVNAIKRAVEAVKRKPSPSRDGSRQGDHQFRFEGFE